MLEFFDDIHPNCEKCGLYETCESPWMPVSGEGKKKILIVAEAAGETEDELNTQLVGKAGNLLRKTCKKLGFDIDVDAYKTNAIICRPPKNKTPTKTQIKLCKRNLINTIKELKPKAIFTFGNVPAEMLLGDLLKTTAISSISGTKVPLPEFDTWVFPMFHPSFVLRKKWDKNLTACFEHELKRALKTCENIPEVPKINPYKNAEILTDKKEVIGFLQKLLKEKPLTSFDYETSGKKPYKNGHTIYCVGISLKNKSYAFALTCKGGDKRDKKILALFRRYLSDPKIKKVCHNAQYEYIWSAVIVKTHVKGLIWCTMVTQHLLDNRRKVTGLKHQAAVRWGIAGYDDDISKFIKAEDEKDPHAFNKMHKAPIEKMLLYCSVDALLTMKLYLEQVKEVPKRMREARKFFHMGALLFARMSLTGAAINVKYYREKDAELGKEIEAIDKKISTSKEARQFENEYQTTFLSTSSPILQKFFYSFLKLEATKFTAKDNKSVDEEALKDIDHWIAGDILKKRKIEKLKNTYIGQILREEVNGKIHTEFTLNIARTFRSSALSPNSQNWPKRDKEAMEMIRKGIIPMNDQLLEPDYSGAEVITAAAYNKDSNLIKYLEDENSDMHRDMACDLFILKVKQILKALRKGVKSATFGFFYGSFYKLVGPNMWRANIDKTLEDGTPLKEHLKNHGIKNIDDFTKHVKEVEDKFWNERFFEYKKWKEEINKEYREKGEIWTYLGFRFIGYMDEKQVSNYPIQGTSFHLLLFVLIQMEKWLEKKKKQSKLCLEVHDSGIFDCVKNETASVAKQFQKYTHDLINIFDWLVVPMDSEADVSKVNGNFAEMKELKL